MLARLRTDLHTPWGIYARGLQVRVLKRAKGGLVVICLDSHSWHLGKCHTAEVLASILANARPLPSSRHSRGLVA